jgi:nitrite reductase/ring-hydroxylating ferredoxin subunit
MPRNLMPYVALIPLDRCRREGGTFISQAGRELAVFVMGAAREVVVLDNTCPHAGGNLSGGEVADGIVTCPWHHWAFRLCDGVCVDSAKARVRRYPAEVRDGVVWVHL